MDEIKSEFNFLVLRRLKLEPMMSMELSETVLFNIFNHRKCILPLFLFPPIHSLIIFVCACIAGEKRFILCCLLIGNIKAKKEKKYWSCRTGQN